MTPLQYFYYLRNREGYSRRNAWITTLGMYGTAEDVARRYARQMAWDKAHPR